MQKTVVETAAPTSPMIDWALVPLFAATMFVSASLLFWMQPLFAKMALPFLGGAPAVWNTAMMFFQATLLLGYGYAHFVTRWLSPRRQAVVQIVILAAAFVSLPVAVRGGYDPDSEPITGLVALLTVSIGLPFFAVSTSAPLLQRWFAISGHNSAEDPYFLYGASNLGSVLALLAFPFVLEPSLELPTQGVAWTSGFAVLLLLTGLCALVAPNRTSAAQSPAPIATSAPTETKQYWRQRLLWTALAFAPSSLLMGVTQHISTDVAAIPLLWVIPLALYLLTYVIVFARRPILDHKRVIWLQPYILIPGLIGVAASGLDIRFTITTHLVVFFVLALSCHGELVSRRPEVGRLTEFYLCMSVGGLLGGVFNVLAAPLLFDGIYEYGIAITVAAMLRRGAWAGNRRDYFFDIAVPVAILLAAMIVSSLGLLSSLGDAKQEVVSALFAVVGLVIFGCKDRPLRFGLGIGAALLIYGSEVTGDGVIAQERSFFGVYRVKATTDGVAHQLIHGTTLHGTQLLDPQMKLEPVGYYTRPAPMGQLFRAIRGNHAQLNVGLVGLGIGTTLCYAKPGDRWTVFEIDPLVGRLALDDRFFTHSRDCGKVGAAKFLYGDARLQLQKMPDRGYDLMILDAYSSDAVPIHLLTREALTLYREKLAEGGLLMFHVSNRHLNLIRVLSALVRETGVAALTQYHKPGKDASPYATQSEWVVIAEREQDLALLRKSGNWKKLPKSDLRPWSDNYSNIIGVFR